MEFLYDFILKHVLEISLIVMVVWFLLANRKFKRYVAENPFGDYEQPRTASVLGVFFTFIGIAAGLLNFDPSPEKMHDSVVNLLGGMKTAFVTSIFGMGISLYFKNHQANAQKKFHGVKTESNIADLIVCLREEFRNLNGTLRVNNENVIRELKDFGKTLAESNSKAFIEALNETMKDFNDKLTEQFGENFKQLNIAVGRLLEWQKNYKNTIETVTKNLHVTVAGINDVKNSVKQIEKSATAMTKSSEEIQNLIVTANFYEQKLRQTLSEIKSVSEKTSESIRVLAANIHDVTGNANNMTQKISATTNAAIISMQKLSKELRDESSKIISETNGKINQQMQTNDENLKKSLETLGNAMLKISDKFVEDYMPLVNELRKIVDISKQVKQSGRSGGGLF